SVRFIRYLDAMDDCLLLPVDDRDPILIPYCYRHARGPAQVTGALRALPHRNLVEDLAGLQVDEADRSVVGIDGDETGPVRGDGEAAVVGRGGGRGESQQEHQREKAAARGLSPGKQVLHDSRSFTTSADIAEMRRRAIVGWIRFFHASWCHRACPECLCVCSFSAVLVIDRRAGPARGQRGNDGSRSASVEI